MFVKSNDYASATRASTPSKEQSSKEQNWLFVSLRLKSKRKDNNRQFVGNFCLQLSLYIYIYIYKTKPIILQNFDFSRKNQNYSNKNTRLVHKSEWS